MLGVTRGDEEHIFEMTPQYNEEMGRVLVGISPNLGYKRPWEQIKTDSFMVKRMLGALVAPKNKGERAVVAKNAGGPFMILDMLQEAVQSGLMQSCSFLRMICVNLAIMNLLPIPVLDGGHIVFALYETVTRRKPHPRVVAALVNAFAILLISLMLFLVGRDAVRKVTTVQRQRAIEQQVE
jgi:RIP metalloprotease RseP